MLKAIGSVVKHFILKTSLILPIVSLAAMAQTPAAPLAFEVATIKPAEQITPAMVQAGKMHVGMSVDVARVDIGYMSLYDLLYTAFKVKPYQIEGPDWIRVQRFDVLAKMPPGATKDDVPVMLQGLLKERFKLEYHRGAKDHPIYALVVAPGGLKMKEAEPDVPVDPAAEPKPLAKGEVAFGSGDNAVRLKQGADGTSGTAQTAKAGAVKYSMSPDGIMHYEYEKLEMSLLADALSQFLGKPVIDMTELKGKYHVALDISREDLMAVARNNGVNIPAGAGGGGGGATPAEAASDPGSSTIFTAVRQLGLKLDSRKAPIETVVVERAEKMPTDN
jgi:uncharacterized protein (TIGR03435 family)